ncbi:MAG: nucleotidyltransferase domain-containing protein [Reichenbachiella sp.]
MEFLERFGIWIAVPWRFWRGSESGLLFRGDFGGVRNLDRTKILCKKYGVRNLYVFGSVLTDRINEKSDLDFLINFSDDLSPEEYTDNYFNFHIDLEKLFNKRIDLITEKSLHNPYLIQSINENKELIYHAA